MLIGTPVAKHNIEWSAWLGATFISFADDLAVVVAAKYPKTWIYIGVKAFVLLNHG